MSAAGRGMVLGNGRGPRWAGGWGSGGSAVPCPCRWRQWEWGPGSSATLVQGPCLAVGLLVPGGCPRGGPDLLCPGLCRRAGLGLGLGDAARPIPSTSPLPGWPGSTASIGEDAWCCWRDGDWPLCPSPKMSPPGSPTVAVGWGGWGGLRTHTALLPHRHSPLPTGLQRVPKLPITSRGRSEAPAPAASALPEQRQGRNSPH